MPNPTPPSRALRTAYLLILFVDVLATGPVALFWLILMSKQDHWPEAGADRTIYNCLGYGGPPLVCVLLGSSLGLYLLGLRRAALGLSLFWAVLLAAGYCWFFLTIQD